MNEKKNSKSHSLSLFSFIATLSSEITKQLLKRPSSIDFCGNLTNFNFFFFRESIAYFQNESNDLSIFAGSVFIITILIILVVVWKYYFI